MMDRNRDESQHNPQQESHDNLAVMPERRHFVSVEELTGAGDLEEARVYEIGKPPVAGDGAEVERRDFMKLIGATFAVTAATACGKYPERYALPYTDKPLEITPGLASHYATTCRGCDAGCGVLVKSREGRPIKFEGNAEHPLNMGGVCAVGQASVLDVYDGDRLRGPKSGGKATDWKALNADVAKALEAYKGDGSKLAIVSKPVNGPASKQVYANFAKQFPGARHVVLQDSATAALTAAHQLAFGSAILPGYDFANAKLVISLGADFLGTWLQPVAFAKAWSKNRKISAEQKTMSKHIQVETRMSLSGSNADERIQILPSEMRAIAMGLAERIAKKVGMPLTLPPTTTDKGALLDKWAEMLAGLRHEGLVLSDSSDLAVQSACLAINWALGNYGGTVDLISHYGAMPNGQAEVDKVIDDLKSGAVSGVILVDVNPAYDSPRAADWSEGLKKTGFSLALAQRDDETAQLCKHTAAISHFLESWGDAEAMRGTVAVQQPLVNAIFDTKGAYDLLLSWTADNKHAGMYEFTQAHWQAAVLPRAHKSPDFQSFWDSTVRDGFALIKRGTVKTADADGQPTFFAGGPADAPPPNPTAGLPAEVSAVTAPEAPTAVALPSTPTPTAASVALDGDPPFNGPNMAKGFIGAAAGPVKPAGAGAYELVLYQKVGIRDGSHGNNPLLHELPDPISKATWGNYVCIAPKTAAKMGVGSSDVVAVKAGAVTVELPVVLSPGMHEGAVAIALGYGRKAAGRIGNDIGVHVGGFAALGSAVLVDVSVTGKKDPVAFSQTHHSYEHRDAVRETSLEHWLKESDAGNEALPTSLQDKVLGKRYTRSLWDRHQYLGHKWGMAIDMNACNGCGACIIACNVENNVPVVGKREVLVRREMHWMRIDRYFSEAKAVKGYDWDATEPDLLALAQNPEVVHMPMLCQHCDNAPCENVCPVLATVHTSEGLNAQAYNRCIGTRYCANNCPYKVRRFNWFNYPSAEMEGKLDVDLVALALNPDVVKRSRGVMEKCTFCVQRIADAKAEVVRGGRAMGEHGKILKDGEVLTACQQSCPTQAIAFGDLNDEGSAVRKMYNDPRNYSALGEIGTQPAVTYMTKVRNSTRAGSAPTEG